MLSLFSYFEPTSWMGESIMNWWVVAWGLCLMPIWGSSSRLNNNNIISVIVLLWNNNMMKSKSWSVPRFSLGLGNIMVAVNLIGMLPYSFPISSHLSFTLVISLLCMSPVVSYTLGLNAGGLASHLVPYASPLGLAPLLASSEMVGYFIRPMTLAIRLMANMTAGHLILTMVISVSCLPLFSVFNLSLIPIHFIILSLELFVCVIQAYVFILLISLYISEI